MTLSNSASTPVVGPVQYPVLKECKCFTLVQIRDKLSIIDTSHKELVETYHRRLEEFEHNLDAQIFHRDAEQAEAWISFREAFLGNEDDDLGVRSSGCRREALC